MNSPNGDAELLVPVQLLGTAFPGQGCCDVEPGTAMLGAAQGYAMLPCWHVGQDMRDTGLCSATAPLSTGGLVAAEQPCPCCYPQGQFSMFSTCECHPTAQRAHPQHHQLAWCHLHVLSHQSWFWISVLVHLSIPAPFSLSCAPCLPSSPWPQVPVSHGRVSPRQEHPWCQHSHMFPGVPHPWMPAPACSHRGTVSSAATASQPC